MNSSKKRSAAAREADRRKKKRLYWGAGITAVVAMASILIATTYWESVHPVPARRLVKVYVSRGCVCADPWIEDLRSSGFVVDRYPAGDMHLLRHKKHVPDHLQGCHLGEYLGYFLDGHIPAIGLNALAQLRPSATGIGMASDMIVLNSPIASSADDKNAMVIFYGKGNGQLWSIPDSSEKPSTNSNGEHQ